MIFDKVKKHRKKILIALAVTVVFPALLIVFSNSLVYNTSQSKIYSEVDKLPANNVGLVLGTSSRSKGGNENLFFKYRIEAAAELYRTGKIKHILVSGDNRVKYYNEPRDMMNALKAKGVPASAITLDYAGFRTLDSVVRCKKVFGQSSYTIISQEFHNERALFLASKSGIDAIAYNARDVSFKYSKITYLREYLARTKAVIDIYVLKTQPKFLGEKEHIQLSYNTVTF